MSEVDLTGKVIDGRYRVVERLGRGGMGAVFRVQHIHSHEHFALKVLHPQVAADKMMVERFVREARAAAALRSKHVVKVVDAQRDFILDGRPMPYLVMELLTGSNLEGILERRGPLPSAEVAWMLKQIGKALDQAHERGIVHRDLKPENIFIALDEDAEAVTKICDFGIAKLIGESAIGLMATGSLDTSPSSLGTPMYMSPEQLRDSSSVDARTDQWALALIVFRSLRGREYFGDAKSSGQLMARILVEPIVAPSAKGLDLGAAFDAWFLRSCAREPEGRWPNVGAQVKACLDALDIEATPIVVPRDTKAIESAATGVAPAVPVTGAPSATTNKVAAEGTSRRRRFAIALATVIVVVFGVFAGMRLRSMPTVATAAPATSSALPPGAPTTTTSPAIPPTPTVATMKAAPGLTTATPVIVVPGKVVAPTKSAKPVVSASASAVVVPTKSTKLPSGAACSRGGECASGYCFAEQCQ